MHKLHFRNYGVTADSKDGSILSSSVYIVYSVYNVYNLLRKPYEAKLDLSLPTTVKFVFTLESLQTLSLLY